MLASVVALLSAAAAAVVAVAVPEAASGGLITAPAGVTTFSGHCDHDYCESGTSWCFYWAGMTSYNIMSGPSPGEVRTSIGPCGTAAYASAATPTAS